MTGTIDDATKKAMAEVKANVRQPHTYLGTVIGGHAAGTRKSSATDRLVWPPQPSIVGNATSYRHVIILGVHLWVPEGWDEQELMAELVGSYRPLKQF